MSTEFVMPSNHLILCHPLIHSSNSFSIWLSTYMCTFEKDLLCHWILFPFFFFFLSNIVLLSPHACGDLTHYLGSIQSSPGAAFSLLEASLLPFATLGWESARNGSWWAKGMLLMMSTRVDCRTLDTCSLNFAQFSHSGSFRGWWVHMPTRPESRILFPHSWHHLRSSAFFQID